MSEEMPDKIWAMDCMDGPVWYELDESDEYFEDNSQGFTKYIRADLIAELEAKLTKLRAIVVGLQQASDKWKQDRLTRAALDLGESDDENS